MMRRIRITLRAFRALIGRTWGSNLPLPTAISVGTDWTVCSFHSSITLITHTSSYISISHSGWRVEFRTIEAQITDFENAAFVTFCMLLSRAILSFKCNFYIPLSLVHINMERAQMKDAVLTQKFWFRYWLSRFMFNRELVNTLFI